MFGLVTFLMHAGLERSTIQKHLLAFSVAAPLMAISTYFILSLVRYCIQKLKLSSEASSLFFYKSSSNPVYDFI